MKTSFRFRKIYSDIFGHIYRPYADVTFVGKNLKHRIVTMVVDTGADYTVLPKREAALLGIDVNKDCFVYTTYGVGGSQTIYLYKQIHLQFNSSELTIPVGFLDSDDVPPLLGRHGFMEIFKTCFDNHMVYFSK